MRVIGIGHKARQGKDTLAKFITQEAATKGLHVRTYGFADALRAYCRVAFGMTEKNAPLLQYIGTDVFRKRDPEIWVRVLADTMAEQWPDVAVITDVRFPNEAKLVQRLGGILVRVQRIGSDGKMVFAKDRPLTHPSEVALNDWDDWNWSIDCKEGDLDRLRYMAAQIVNSL